MTSRPARHGPSRRRNEASVDLAPSTMTAFPDEYEFTDDVLGRVHLNQLERDCVDTPEYRRLFRLSQLGLVDRLYHTANHTRGIHSIGVCYHAKQLVDHLNRNTPRVTAARGRRRDLPASTLPTIASAERCLISLAGLLHDLPHGPLSHDIEKKTHRYGDRNATKLRSCYGPYPKHDDCENNPGIRLAGHGKRAAARTAGAVLLSRYPRYGHDAAVQ